MPRFGKGKPMEQQARLLLKKHLDQTSRHAAKQAAGVKGARSTGKIHSQGTFNKYAGALKNAGEWMRAIYGVRHLGTITREQAQAYLEHRAEHGIGQKQLDADRLAMQFITGKLDPVHAHERTVRGPRAYTREQVHMVAKRQTERNALATHLVYNTGLRAHELLTLRRRDEAAPAAHRTWHPDRFKGRDGERYVVTGKGGLKREVLVPHDLAARLEAKRLDDTKNASDRKIYYPSRYNIGGGHAWSSSFGRAADRALGRSNGGHGLRHSYVQERIDELQRRYYSFREAMLIVSQELGHFRADVIYSYLR